MSLMIRCTYARNSFVVMVGVTPFTNTSSARNEELRSDLVYLLLKFAPRILTHTFVCDGASRTNDCKYASSKATHSTV